jgi:malonate transporter and related proteins
MTDILALSIPLYLSILLGFLATRLGLFVKADMRVLGKFVMNFALPALLFNALSQRPLKEVIHGDYLLAYALGSLLVLACGMAWARWRHQASLREQAYFAMGLSCSNSGYMGYPAVVLVLGGPVAGVALALCMIVENLLILPLLLSIADHEPGSDAHWLRSVGQTLMRLLRNPMILAILAGFMASLMGWRLPEPVARTVTLFSQGTSALALFVIGGTLVGLRIRGVRRLVAQIALGKLVLHPLVMLAVLLWVVPVADPQLRTAALLFAAMPMLGIYPLVAARHGQEELSAAALLTATAGSFFTLSALLWALKQVPAWG